MPPAALDARCPARGGRRVRRTCEDGRVELSGRLRQRGAAHDHAHRRRDMARTCLGRSRLGRGIARTRVFAPAVGHASLPAGTRRRGPRGRARGTPGCGQCRTARLRRCSSRRVDDRRAGCPRRRVLPGGRDPRLWGPAQAPRDPRGPRSRSGRGVAARRPRPQSRAPHRGGGAVARPVRRARR